MELLLAHAASEFQLLSESIVQQLRGHAALASRTQRIACSAGVLDAVGRPPTLRYLLDFYGLPAVHTEQQKTDILAEAPRLLALYGANGWLRREEWKNEFGESVHAQKQGMRLLVQRAVTHRFAERRLQSGLSIGDFANALRNLSRSLNGDWALEGYGSAMGQKASSVTWAWGHDFCFGSGPGRLEVRGHMGGKAVEDLVQFSHLLGFNVPHLFRGARVLDVGSWAGATSFLLCAMNASHVTSVEEVRKYTAVTRLVAKAYSLPIEVLSKSVYELEETKEHVHTEVYDIVYMPGVLYHLSDPILALRILYNRLRLGGLILVETTSTGATWDIQGPILHYDRIAASGNNYFGMNAVALRGMLEDVGFTLVMTATVPALWAPRPADFAAPHPADAAGFGSMEPEPAYRLYAVAAKLQRVPLKRSGLSSQAVC